jgi:hypothetical protein
MIVDASLVGATCEGTARAEEVVSFYDMRIGAWRPDEVLQREFATPQGEWGEQLIWWLHKLEQAVVKRHSMFARRLGKLKATEGGRPVLLTGLHLQGWLC